MPTCASCKNKTSNERCPSLALQGLTLCGRHARTKTPRLWAVVNDVDRKVTLISKIWRGWFTRKKFKLAGPGVLDRSLCVNQDDLLTLEPIKSIDTFNYFGFEENKKVYGFDIRAILDCLNKNIIPINPYTRQPISIETRKRLREVYAYRVRNKLDTTSDKSIQQTVDDILLNKWTQISQIAEENGFFNINPNLFLSLGRTQLYIFLSMINNDLKTWFAEHKNPTCSRRFWYVFWTSNILKKFPATLNSQKYSFYVSSVLLSILYDSVEPYTVCFLIMSALYRL